MLSVDRLTDAIERHKSGLFIDVKESEFRHATKSRPYRLQD
jgi:hypothetical protein